MGLLAETKIRKRISHDPNNTKWSRDTTTFGQKILRAQGWQPGEYLGAKDASHSELHTAANASYIRVALKDDMKGLGFDRSRDNEVTGLDVFSDLLGRLNGRSESAIADDKMARMVVKTNIYVERRWGPMRFVKGGLLVGDELKEVKEEDEKDEKSDILSAEDVEEVLPAVEDSKTEKKSKKRKAASIEDVDSSKEADSKKKQRKEERKSKKSRSEPTPNDAEEPRTDDAKTKKKEKKEKKSRKDKSRSKDEEDEAESDERSKKRKSKSRDKKDRSKDLGDDGAAEERKSKKSKKEKKKRRKEAADSSDSDAEPTSTVSTGISTPGGGTTTPTGNRNFVRSRFIAQKKQAMLDTKALNQIFMIKA